MWFGVLIQLASTVSSRSKQLYLLVVEISHTLHMWLRTVQSFQCWFLLNYLFSKSCCSADPWSQVLTTWGACLVGFLPPSPSLSPHCAALQPALAVVKFKFAFLGKVNSRLGEVEKGPTLRSPVASVACSCILAVQLGLFMELRKIQSWCLR